MPVSEKEKAPILVVPAQFIAGEFPSYGFLPDPKAISYVEDLVASRLHRYLPRAEAEVNKAWVQPVVPYMTICGDKLLVMAKRSKRTVEEEGQYIEDRIQTDEPTKPKLVLFASGHLVEADVNHGPTADAWGFGELNEELVMPSQYEIRRWGIVNDRTTDVGLVHTGLVHQVEVPSLDVRIRDTNEFVGAEWVTIKRIEERFGEMDSWSILLAKELLKETAAKKRSIVVWNDAQDPFFFIEKHERQII